MKLSQEKLESLKTYLNKLQDRVAAPVSKKHALRGSHGALLAFLKLEIDRTKAKIAASRD